MADPNTSQPPVSEAQTAAGRYDQLSSIRSPALQRARDVATITIPALMPPEGTNDTSILPTPFQSVGARGVNNLSAKLLLALFPPGSSFFRLDMDEFAKEKLKQKAAAAGEENDPFGEIEAALQKIEKAVCKRMEQEAMRPVLNETLKHLIVAGNGLLQIGKTATLRLHTLPNYVCKRDGQGEPIEMIVKEDLNRKSLPAPILAIVNATESQGDKQADPQNNIPVYTWIQRQPSGAWIIHQEVCGCEVPGTAGSYPKGKCAWLPLRWTTVPGSDYGRGHGEEYLGDLQSLESLSQSIIEFAANASKIVWLVNEGGVTLKSKLEKARSGAIIDGDLKDVKVLMMEKFADFQVASGTADKIEKRLEQAFLLNSSVQRQAERVTAEEIRFMAGELEQALGGTYSVLAHEMQFPLVVRIMAVMQRQGKLPSLPDKLVSPQIITGLDGLGRSSDLQKLDVLMQDVAALVTPDHVAEYVNIGALIERRAVALGIDISGLVRSEADVKKARAAEAQQQMLQKVAPAGVKAMSDQAIAARQTAAPASQ